MMKKYFALLTGAFCLTVFTCLARTDNFGDYSRLLSPEKLYLHTDREVYNVGDTIWFKGYLINASGKQEYKECNYLYVELLSPKWELNIKKGVPENTMRHRTRVKVKRNASGEFTGYLPLTEDYNTGLATLRAYSYWMMNSSPDYMFSKNIELLNPMKDGFVKDLVELKTTEQSIYDNLGVENPFRKTLFPRRQKNEAFIDVQFLPESGRYLAGVPSTIAVKAINGEGLGVKVKGEVYADGNQIASFETNFLGMGKFTTVVPAGTREVTARCESYVENFEIESEIPLPEKMGVTINVQPDNAGVFIKVADAGITLPDSTYLIVYDKSQIVLQSPYSESRQGKRAEYSDLVAGINTIAVVDNEGNVYAERPFFVYPKGKITVATKFDKERYDKREKARVEFEMKDEAGRPVNGNFSVAVTDEEFAPYSGEGHTIESYFLLGSELKGMVEKPQHYFTDSISIETRRNDIDLLLMTQGWNYYDLEKILKGKTVAPKYGKEYTQSLSGYVNGVLGKAKKSTLCFLAPSIDYRQIEDLDSTAYFALNGLDFPDSTQFIVGAQGRGKMFKKWYLPILNPEYFAAEYNYPNYLKNRGYSEEYGEYAIQSYYVNDGSLTYTLAPSRIVASNTLNLSPYPNDSFRQGQYRDEKKLEPYNDIPVFDYIVQTCPGVRRVGDALLSRGVPDSKTNLTERQSSYVPINIYINGFPGTCMELQSLMVSDLEAFVYINDANSLKYLRSMSDLRLFLSRPATILVKTRWPVHNASNITADRPLGWQRPAKFYVPKYETKASKSKFEPMRSTLHWEPALDVRDGRASFEFYTSDHQVPYSVILEGLSDEGDAVTHHTECNR